MYSEISAKYNKYKIVLVKKIYVCVCVYNPFR